MGFIEKLPSQFSFFLIIYQNNFLLTVFSKGSYLINNYLSPGRPIQSLFVIYQRSKNQVRSLVILALPKSNVSTTISGQLR